MIRVLHFSKFINRYDFIDTVLTGLDRSKFEVHALTAVPSPGVTGEYSDDEKYESKCLNIEFTRRNYPQIFSALRDEIRRIRPHILQSHHFDETVMAAIAARQLKVPGFVIGHQYSDHIYVLTRGLKRSAYLTIEGWCNSSADKIVVPTQEVVELLEGQGVAKEKIVRNPYGTDLGMLGSIRQEDIEALRDEFGLMNRFVVLVCCRLNKEKGLDHMLRAVPEIAAKHPDLKLVVVGTGPYEQELKRLKQELGLGELVTFAGWRTDTMNWYSVSDVVVQPSLSESFCQVVTEALAVKRPIVVTPVGIAPEVIVSGERGGYLVPIGESEPIAAAIIRLIEDPDLRKRLAETGHEYVRDNMSTAATARRYEDLYKEVLAGKTIE